MARRIVVDPMTRIEGHLRIEAEAEGGRIREAWASSTMWRGMEIILKGRDPRDAWAFTQRVCGVCTTVHAIASIRAVENALDYRVPRNANLMRNLVLGFQYVQDHAVHFYVLHALDWVDVVSALRADPAQTSRIAQSISSWPKSSTAYFKDVQQKLQDFVNSGQLGIFTNGYWGHPAYKLPPEVNLLGVAHYLEVLDWQREIIKPQTIIGGKNPHPNWLVGGMACPINLNDTGTLNSEELSKISAAIDRAVEFVEQVYFPDLVAVAGFYKDWAAIGGGARNYLAYGEFPSVGAEEIDSLFLPRGVIVDRNLNEVEPFDPDLVTEYVTHSWYSYSGGDDVALHPFEGETKPNYTGPQPPYDALNVDDKYTWMKAPRYRDMPMEVGPLARMLVAYASGHDGARELVTEVLGRLDAPPSALFSTLGRTAARGIETVLVARQLREWYNALIDNIKNGDLATFNPEKWDPDTWPAETRGFGYMEAPRGALGHWVRIKDKRIENYQLVVPSTWNCSPRDARGNKGPYELSLTDNHPLMDPERPIEILRTIHSFDPCMACGVHVLDPEGRELVAVTVQ
jgi:Ni,Fe-hydrogenase I large subunit